MVTLPLWDCALDFGASKIRKSNKGRRNHMIYMVTFATQCRECARCAGRGRWLVARGAMAPSMWSVLEGPESGSRNSSAKWRMRTEAIFPPRRFRSPPHCRHSSFPPALCHLPTEPCSWPSKSSVRNRTRSQTERGWRNGHGRGDRSAFSQRKSPNGQIWARLAIFGQSGFGALGLPSRIMQPLSALPDCAPILAELFAAPESRAAPEWPEIFRSCSN
jgi:hypothetical protein